MLKDMQPTSRPPQGGKADGKEGEQAILRQIRTRAAAASRGGLRLGIGDDCALLRLKADEELAVTTDLSLDGRHFRLGWHAPESIGHRALARGLSDLAAMGARPVAAFLSLGLPRELVQNRPRRQPWVERFLNGFFALAQAHQTPLAGGDLAESPIAVADVILTGAVKRGRALLRSGARPGNRIYVTGALGGAAAGLACLSELADGRPVAKSSSPSAPLRTPARLASRLAPHLYPQPRIAQGLWLARRGAATAAIDLSDGLSTDLTHLCEESSVSAEVDARALPLHPQVSLEQALHGGEDYELLFTAAAAARLPRSIAGVPVTCIGRITRPSKSRPAVTLVTAGGSQPLTPQGWQHFRRA